MAADNPTLLRGNLMEGFLWLECSRSPESLGTYRKPPGPTHCFSIYSDERVKDRRSIQIKCKILHKPCSNKNVGTFTLCTCRSRIYMEWGKVIEISERDWWCQLLTFAMSRWYCFYISLKIISLPLAQPSLTSELVWLQAFTFSHTHGPIF